MNIGINSGALWGMIMVILIYLLIHFVRKKRNERRWIKYGEDKIYRPDEWDTKCGRRNESGNGTIDSGESKVSGEIREPSGIGGDVRQEDIQTQHNKDNSDDTSRDKESVKTNEWDSITIPDIEPID